MTLPWQRLDDAFYRNPKQLRLSDGAFRLYVCSLSYCADAKEPTGYMTAEQALGLARSLKKNSKTIQELLENFFWETTSGGYLIHDFEEYVEKGSRDRVRAWRDRKRAEAQANRNVTGNQSATLPRGRARAPVPVPEPVPVVGDEVTSPSEPTNPPAVPPSPQALGASTQNGELPQVLRWMQLWSEKAGGRALTEPEREFLRRVPYECDRLSEQQVAETLTAIAEKHWEAGKRVPLVTYAAGKLADLQAAAAENGARPQSPRPTAPTRLSETLGRLQARGS